jgi:hypothetical protein
MLVDMTFLYVRKFSSNKTHNAQTTISSMPEVKVIDTNYITLHYFSIYY